jgi:hypothetical protein
MFVDARTKGDEGLFPSTIIQQAKLSSSKEADQSWEPDELSKLL